MSDNTHPQLAGQAALPYLNRFLDPTSSVLLVLVTVVLDLVPVQYFFKSATRLVLVVHPYILSTVYYS